LTCDGEEGCLCGVVLRLRCKKANVVYALSNVLREVESQKAVLYASPIFNLGAEGRRDGFGEAEGVPFV